MTDLAPRPVTTRARPTASTSTTWWWATLPITSAGGHAFLWTTGVVPFYGLSLGPNDLDTLADNAGVLPTGW